MNKQQLKSLVLICVSSLLTGCFENKHDTDRLCANNPELKCEELNMDDGQCRITRTDLIWHRLNVIKDPNDLNKITEYKLTLKYRQCLEVAAQIQVIDQTTLIQNRFNALMNAGNNLDRISKELSQYHTPEALYFLWSQNGDADARREFLQMEGKPQLNTARMQYALATFYIDKNHIKTLDLLNNALELSTDKDTLNLDIIKSLASVNQFLRNKERSYIWAMVASSFNIPIANKESLNLLYHFSDDKYKKLDDIADEVTDAIKDGRYKRKLIPDYIK